MIETTDPRLSEAAIAEACVRRVAMVLPVGQMQALAALHDVLGEELTGPRQVTYPPADYVPPAQE